MSKKSSTGVNPLNQGYLLTTLPHIVNPKFAANLLCLTKH